jgi:8-oxo-dGTP pyrophosphatase MutT (NUDIX family)
MTVESIEISKFDPHHPLLSPDPSMRPFEVKSVGVFAVLLPIYNSYVAVWQRDAGWSIPAGRVERSDTDPLSAAMRELVEETGGGIDKRDFTHMGIVTRRGEGSNVSRSLVFRARVSQYHFGITHELTSNLLRIGGDDESIAISFIKIGKYLPDPIYRPDINIPVIEAFSKIED